METIKFDLKDYYIVVNLKDEEVAIVCKEAVEELGKHSKRIYDFPCEKPVKNIELIEDYLHIYFQDKTDFQIKLQSSSEIVLDYFSAEGELIDVVGAWEFWGDFA